jgi:hypothetical protein
LSELLQASALSEDFQPRYLIANKTDCSLDIWNPVVVAMDNPAPTSTTEKVRRVIVSLKTIREFVHLSLEEYDIIVI